MKKLMIALSAATLVALGAKAAIPDGYTSGIDFEDTKLGYLNVTLDDSNEYTEDAKLWSSAAKKTDGTVDSTVVEGNYLKIDETEVLTRSAGEVAGAIPENGGNITISTKVQFTAADEAPDAKLNAGDKLLVWAKAPAEESGAITLQVTALNEDGDDVAVYPSTYTVTDNAWYDLAIVAEESDGNAPMKFTVKIQGATDEDFVTIGTYESLVLTGDATTSIASIGFKGTGAVDDIGFKSEQGYKPADITVTVAGNALDYGVQFGDDEYTEPVAMKARDKVTLVVFADETDTVESTKGTPAWDEDASAWKIEYTLTDEDAGEEGALTITITVTPGGDPTSPIVPTIDPEGATVEGIPEGGFVVGTEYTVADITATPSAAHKTANVVIKINGEAVTAETFTLAAGDTVTIEVTEEDIKVNVTVDAAEGTTVTGVTAGQVVEGSTLTFTVTVADGYKNLVVKNGETTLEAVEGTYTVTADADVAITTTVDAITYATITVDADYGVESVTLKVDGEVIDPKTYKADVADAVEVTVAYTLKSGKVLADGCTVPETVTLTESKKITITTQDEQSGSLPGTDLLPAEDAEGYNAWAAANGITVDSTDTEGAAAALAFKMGLTIPEGKTIEEAEKAAVDAAVKLIDASLLATNPAAAIAAIKEQYPNVEVSLEPVSEDEIDTTATLYRLKIELKPLN